MAVNVERLDQIADGVRLDLIGKPVEVGAYDKDDDSLIGYIIGRLESIVRTGSTVAVVTEATGAHQSYITFDTDETYALVTYILP